jgi:hypothetical protein
MSGGDTIVCKLLQVVGLDFGNDFKSALQIRNLKGLAYIENTNNMQSPNLLILPNDISVQLCLC